MSRVLVTGSQGVLGTALVTELRKRSHDVTGVGRRHGVDTVRADIAEIEQLKDAFSIARPEVCVHLAGEFGRQNGLDYPEQLWRNNCLGTHNVIEVCAHHEVRLVFASSSEAYGDLADSNKLQEVFLDRCSPHFHNEYALTKWTNEKQIGIAVANHGLNATILRFFNVYGPGEHFTPYRSVIAQFIYKALKNLPVTVYTGTSRSFLYVDDWSHAVANVCDTPTTSGEAFNIGSPVDYSLDVVWGMVKDATGTRVKPTCIDSEPHNVRDKHADVGKAQRVFGLQDTVDLKEGITRTVAWQRSIYGC